MPLDVWVPHRRHKAKKAGVVSSLGPPPALRAEFERLAAAGARDPRDRDGEVCVYNAA